jgi:hypothetical protein
MANEERGRDERDYGRGYGGREARRGGAQGDEGGRRGREAARWDQDRSFAPDEYAPEPRYDRYGRGRYGGAGESPYRGYGSDYGAAYGGGGSYGYGGGLRTPYGGAGRRDGGFGEGGAYRQGYGGQDVESDGGWFGFGHGDHRGRGPKGYTRSDERIREDVHDRLADDSWIDASDIEVQVQDGEITLSGEVDSRDAKHRAEHVVEDVSGARHVQNNLRVRDSSARRGAAAATTASQRT